MVGDNTGTVIDSYAAGMVTGDNSHGGYIGGLIGVNSGPVSNCYAAGAVSGFAYVGGLIGDNGSTVGNCFWDTETSGQATSAGGEGKTTAEMQTLSTFADGGWDFSADDGDAADWLMPAVSYPRLAWEKIITFSPDGGTYLSKQHVIITYPSPTATIHYTVNGNTPTESDPVIASGSSVLISKSMTLKARAWEEGLNPSEIKSANYQIDLICPTADLNGDCKVNLEDFAILSQWWLGVCNVTNGWCGGADLDASGLIDTDELEDVTRDNLEEEEVASHIKELTVIAQRDYGDAHIQQYYGKTMTYDIYIQVSTDATVTAVEFTTPAGNTFSIPATVYTWRESHPDGLLSYGLGIINPDWLLWEYEYKFFNESSLDAYGDGLYTFTVHYTDGGSQQTTAWFGIPETTDPIPTPTQIPTFTSFVNGQTVNSPVTFTWQACTDPAIQAMAMGIVYVDFWSFEDTTATGLAAPISLSAGEHDVWLLFESYYGYDNEDGISVGACKQNQSHYKITVN
ncbi:MAG: hypothetical protein FJ263_04085 [Planctomycetes bacterium]|nr:hypothetical protein [Planctomycetota bacterium]